MSAEGLELQPVGGGTRLRVAARPGAPRSGLVGVHGGALKVAIKAPPEKGKANKELISLLADRLGLKRTQLELTRGTGSRDKAVLIRGLEPGEVRERLAAYLSAQDA